MVSVLSAEDREKASGVGYKPTVRDLRFYYPQPRFPSVSVTGTRCQLGCKHCRGHYLKGMKAVESPSRLKDFCTALDEARGVGLLVSGGSDTRGHVPLEGFYEALGWVKENTDLIVNVHTGLMGRKEAEELASTGVDIASVDLVGSDETIKRVYGLDASVEEYEATLYNLREGGIKHVIPHICVGLDYGETKGEEAALRIVQAFKPENVVILGLIPTPGTPMEHVEPPSALEISRFIASARSRCPASSVSLGCMRSRRDKNRVERKAIEAGADRLVLPSNTTLRWASMKGFGVKHLDGCCAIPKEMEHRCKTHRPPA